HKFPDAGERQYGPQYRLLDERVFETRINDLDRVDHALEKLLHHELDEHLDLRELNAIAHGKIRDHVTVRTGDELRTLATNDIIFRRRLNFRDELEEIRVERSGETFVRSD